MQLKIFNPDRSRNNSFKMSLSNIRLDNHIPMADGNPRWYDDGDMGINGIIYLILNQ